MPCGFVLFSLLFLSLSISPPPPPVSLSLSFQGSVSVGMAHLVIDLVLLSFLLSYLLGGVDVSNTSGGAKKPERCPM